MDVARHLVEKDDQGQEPRRRPGPVVESASRRLLVQLPEPFGDRGVERVAALEPAGSGLGREPEIQDRLGRHALSPLCLLKMRGG